jgi:hypothetical protein
VTATYEATVNGFLVEIIVNSQGRAPIRLKWSSNLLKLIPDKKQRAGHFGEAYLYPHFSKTVLEMTCSEWKEQADQASSLPCPHHERCSYTNTNYDGRIAYLQVWMSENGLVCTEPTVKELLGMMRNGGEAHLILASVWDPRSPTIDVCVRKQIFNPGLDRRHFWHTCLASQGNIPVAQDAIRT